MIAARMPARRSARVPAGTYLAGMISDSEIGRLPAARRPTRKASEALHLGGAAAHRIDLARRTDGPA